MGANRGRDIPDSTPPFLTKDAIDGWIGEAMNALRLEIKDELHDFDKGQLHLIHKVEKLAGDGKNDEGAVGRLAKLVADYIAENREASSRASEERQKLNSTVTTMSERVAKLEESEERGKRVEEQVNRWKLIPIITRHMWKIIAAILSLVLFIDTMWTRHHPQPVTLTPQQMQELRKAP
jgi:hypothetical protein